MAEKQVKIKVVTETETSEVQDLAEYIQELQDTQINIDATTDSADIETLQSELTEATNEVESLETELANIELGTIDADFTEVSSQLEEASNRVDELQNGINNIESSNVTGLTSEFDSLGNSVNNASNDVEEMQQGIDLLNAQALLGVGTEISNLGHQAEDMAQGMNDASITVGQLATQTGIAEPQMRNLIGYISNATFPQEEAMMYVKSLDQIGVSSDNLGESATNLDKINDAFGLGANTVNSLGQELSVLGVDMNDVSSSFNALAYANSNTVGGMENYYNFLRRYDSQFNELGYNVDQASVIIAGATQKFGGGRAALTGLSTALKESNGDSRKLEEALGLQSGALDNASQITGQYEGQLQQLAKEEAEHKTITQILGEAYQDLSMQISPVLSPLSSFMGLIGQAGGFAVGANGINTLVKSLTGFDILNGVNSRFGKLRQTVSGVGSTVRNAGAGFLQFGRDLGGSVITAVKNGITSFITLGKEVWNAGLNAIKSAGAWLIAKGQMIASTLATWAQTAAQTALNFVMNMNPIMLVVMAIGALIAVLGYLYFNNEQVRAAIDGLGQTFIQIGQIIYTAVVGAINWIISSLQGLWNYIMSLPSQILMWLTIIYNIILFNVLQALAFIGSIPGRVASYLNNVINTVFAWAGNFVNSIRNAAMNAVNGFSNAIKGIGQAIQNCLNWAYNIFMSHPIVKAAVDLGRAIANGFSALGLGQHSPGRIYKAMHSELDWTSELINSDNSLINDASRLGSDVVDAFGNPSLGVDTSFANSEFLNATVSDESKATGNGQTLIFNIRDNVIDDDKRMNKIVDEITRRLAFNNETAGRTV